MRHHRSPWDAGFHCNPSNVARITVSGIHTLLNGCPHKRSFDKCSHFTSAYARLE